MENASQALFMAAGVLIAVMLISFAVFLFSSASGVSKDFDQTMSDTEILKFNSQFTKYITSDSNQPDDGDIILKYNSYNTISDVVSVINLAYSLNEDYDCDEQRGIQVVIDGIDGNLKLSGSKIRNYTISSENL